MVCASSLLKLKIFSLRVPPKNFLENACRKLLFITRVALFPLLFLLTVYAYVTLYLVYANFVILATPFVKFLTHFPNYKITLPFLQAGLWLKLVILLLPILQGYAVYLHRSLL